MFFFSSLNLFLRLQLTCVFGYLIVCPGSLMTCLFNFCLFFLHALFSTFSITMSSSSLIFYSTMFNLLLIPTSVFLISHVVFFTYYTWYRYIYNNKYFEAMKIFIIAVLMSWNCLSCSFPRAFFPALRSF